MRKSHGRSLFAAILISCGAIGTVAAEPMNERYLHHIGAGSTVELAQSVTILPNELYTLISKSADNKTHCGLVMKTRDVRERVIVAGTKWEITRTDSSRTANNVMNSYVYLQSKSAHYLVCNNPAKWLTFGQFAQLTTGALHVLLSTPLIVSGARPIDFTGPKNVQTALSFLPIDAIWP